MNEGIQNKIQTSKIFLRFKKIPDKAFHDYYFFYHFYKQQLSSLEFEEYIEIKFNYVQALFHLDKYQSFYKYSEELLTELLNHQNFEFRLKIIYEQVLAYKAEAYKNENKLQLAQKLYFELMRLNPSDKLYRRKLFYLLFQNEQIKNRKKAGIVVMLLLISLLSTGISIFVIEPFFKDWATYIIICRNVFFICGVSGYLILQGLQLKSAWNKVRSAGNKIVRA